MEPNIHIFPDNEGVARGFAEWLADWLARRSGATSLALSGGSTPKVLFQLLAEEFAEQIDWQQVQLYWVDERCVPPDDPESNYGMTQELLLKHIDIPMANIHRMKGENNPQDEAERYAEILESELRLSEDGYPIFDLIMLGMGADGHTASIFPHEKELLTAEAGCAVATQPETGQKRITLTGHVINRARQVVFLVTGAAKAEKVCEIIREQGEWMTYPAAHIRPFSGKLDWFLDEGAAVEL